MFSKTLRFFIRNRFLYAKVRIILVNPSRKAFYFSIVCTFAAFCVVQVEQMLSKKPYLNKSYI